MMKKVRLNVFVTYYFIGVHLGAALLFGDFQFLQIPNEIGSDKAVQCIAPLQKVASSISSFRSLPPASAQNDGKNLTPRVRGYENNSLFNQKMGLAIDQAVSALRLKKASGEVSKDSIVEILYAIGRKRREAAIEVEAEGAQLYGVQLPEKLADVPTAVTDGVLSNSHPLFGTAQGIAELEFYLRPVADFYRTTGRHSIFYERARAQVKLGKKRIELLVNGKRVSLPLTYFIEKSNREVEGVHPSYEEMGVIKQVAYDLIHRAFSSSLSEEMFMEQMALPHFLLMHGTPFMRGTPACVSALISAMIEVKFGKTFPPPKEGIEVFMEAMFRTPEDFVANYRDFFE